MKPEKRKAALAIILGGMKPKGETGDETAPVADESPDMGLETAMSELIDAIKAEDAKGAAAAFKSAMALLDHDEEPGGAYASGDDEEDDDE